MARCIWYWYTVYTMYQGVFPFKGVRVYAQPRTSIVPIEIYDCDCVASASLGTGLAVHMVY